MSIQPSNETSNSRSRRDDFRLQWVIRGVLARSNRPCYWQTTTVPLIDTWIGNVKKMKIMGILCLLTHEELHEYYGRNGIDLLAAYRNRGLEVHHIPTQDYQKPPIRQSDLAKIKIIFKTFPKPCLVHCSAGIDRTGAAVKIILEVLT